jgi:hypothetical protein
MVTDQDNQPGVSSMIQFIENTVPAQLGTDPLTITSTPERFKGVGVLDDLDDVSLGAYAVVMGTEGNPDSGGPGLWEVGQPAGNTIIFHNSISADMSQFFVDDAIYITWPSEGLSYGPFIITVAPDFNTSNTEYLRVAEQIDDIPIPAGNPPMVLEKSGMNAGDVLTYNGQEWIAQPQVPSLPFSLTDMQEALAESTDFESFKARMACLANI